MIFDTMKHCNYEHTYIYSFFITFQLLHFFYNFKTKFMYLSLVYIATSFMDSWPDRNRNPHLVYFCRWALGFLQNLHAQILRTRGILGFTKWSFTSHLIWILKHSPRFKSYDMSERIIKTKRNIFRFVIQGSKVV